MSLLDWRRRISELYAAVRAESEPVRAWRLWRDARHELFSTHPQSPLPPSGQGMPRYYDHDPELRVLGRLAPAGAVEIQLPGSAGESFAARRFAAVEFDLSGTACRLDAYWLAGYAGGLFLPFRDASSGTETYGGGRYLLDTSKGADLGGGADGLVLDFNFAYHPSCAYDPRWSCPLSPAGNIVAVPVRAGERL